MAFFDVCVGCTVTLVGGVIWWLGLCVFCVFVGGVSLVGGWVVGCWVLLDWCAGYVFVVIAFCLRGLGSCGVFRGFLILGVFGFTEIGAVTVKRVVGR